MISLSRKDVLPYSLTVDGMDYAIDPCFRTVLACLRVAGDPDRPELAKVLYLGKHFFCDNIPPDMGELFAAFLMDGESPDDDGEQMMDFEFDAGAIYASFRQQYNINLLTDDLHWYEFRALLSGLNDATPFGNRIKIRSMDVNDVSEKDRPKLRKLKDTIALKPRVSKAEAELQAELDRRLDAGEDPGEIIKQLQQL